MNIDKIREALEAAQGLAGISPWVGDPEMKRLLLKITAECGKILSELDRVQQPGGVLTNDEVYRVEKSSGVYVIIGPDGRWPFHFSDERLARIRASDFNRVHKAALTADI